MPLIASSYQHWRFVNAPVLLHHNDSEKPEDAHFLRSQLDFHSVLYSPHEGITSVISEGDLSQCVIVLSFLLTSCDLPSSTIVSGNSAPWSQKCHSSCDVFFHNFDKFHIAHLFPNNLLLSLNIFFIVIHTHMPQEHTSHTSFQFGQTHIRLDQDCRVTTQLFSIPALTMMNLPFYVMRPFHISSPKSFETICKTVFFGFFQ